MSALLVHEDYLSAKLICFKEPEINLLKLVLKHKSIYHTTIVLRWTRLRFPFSNLKTPRLDVFAIPIKINFPQGVPLIYEHSPS